MVESIPVLEWKQKNGTLVAKLPDGELAVVPRSGGLSDLWFYESGAWGKNQFLGTHSTRQEAKDYANVWVGDNTTATG